MTTHITAIKAATAVTLGLILAASTAFAETKAAAPQPTAPATAAKAAPAAEAVEAAPPAAADEAAAPADTTPAQPAPAAAAKPAAPAPAPHAAAPAPAQPAPAKAAEAPAPAAAKVSDIKVGAPVVGTDGKKIGVINRVVSDAAGAVLQIHVAPGGSAGLGVPVIAVPAKAIAATGADVKLTLSSEDAKKIPVEGGKG